MPTLSQSEVPYGRNEEIAGRVISSTVHSDVDVGVHITNNLVHLFHELMYVFMYIHKICGVYIIGRHMNILF